VERRWFEGKVLGKSRKQLSDTMRFLQEAPDVSVSSQRGRLFNLASRSYSKIVKVIGYLLGEHLPVDCRSIKHHISRSQGFIHILDLRDYLEIARTLRVPQEVLEYFG
jgi:hypothetical protein